MSDNASSVKTILLVEDDFALAMGTEYTLKAEGYGVVHAKNLAEAREALNVNDPAIDLILLDVMLPDGDGFSFLEELVDAGAETPVIFATAVGDEVNIVRGLDLGADDYITKPYKVKEMLSRISAVLRRQERAVKKAQSTDEEEFGFGSHLLNLNEFRLYENGNPVECTPAEIRLLRELIRNKGIVLTRNRLMERLYDSENAFIDDNTLSVYVKRLRDKLGDDAAYIKTVKGVGYRFEI
ncbi:MAG: response regulator transcription factor [Eubacterium sp.]|nr:response regulator transcription factor [Eubacterium sp.]